MVEEKIQEQIEGAHIVWVNFVSGEPSRYLGVKKAEHFHIPTDSKVVEFTRNRYIPVLDDLWNLVRDIVWSWAGAKTFDIFIPKDSNFDDHLLLDFKIEFIDDQGKKHIIIPLDGSSYEEYSTHPFPVVGFGNVKRLFSENGKLIKVLNEKEKLISSVQQRNHILERDAAKVPELQIDLKRKVVLLNEVNEEKKLIKHELDELKIRFSDLINIIEDAEKGGESLSDMAKESERAELSKTTVGMMKGESEVREKFILENKGGLEKSMEHMVEMKYEKLKAKKKKRDSQKDEE